MLTAAAWRTVKRFQSEKKKHARQTNVKQLEALGRYEPIPRDPGTVRGEGEIMIKKKNRNRNRTE